MTKRARRGIAGSVLVVLGLVIGAVVVTALQAEGRERSEANTNDGGAWLLKRDVGYVGHVNRAVGELTAALSTSEPGSDYDVDQAKGVIAVHDRTAGTLGLVDDRTDTVLETLQVDPDVAVHAVDGGALVVKRDSMSVWRLSRDEIASLETLDEVEPILRGEGSALSAATPDGHAVIVDQGADNVIFLRPDGSTETSPKLNLTDDAVSLTFLGEDTAVLADPDGDVFVATPDRITPLDTGVTDPDGRPAPLILQQPGEQTDHVVAATADGRLFAIPLSVREGERVESTEIGQLAGGSPVAPLVLGGCVFAVSTAPQPSYSQWCGDQQVESKPLDGAGSELRLRLVNGWVWVNDVDTGAAWVTSPQRRLDRVEDWGAILAQSADDSDENNTENEGGEVIEEINPDDPNAEIVESDEIDEEGPNRPPVARDDQTQTRVDRPIDVDVLANDTDPNGDVLLVTAIEPTGGDAVIAINPDARGVQVSPAAGFTGVVTFGYTISDGRGESASAVVTVEVTASDGTGNRPPEAHADIASTRKGRSTTFDVLANDVDPDGDALVLESIALSDPAATAGTIVSDPSGRVVFTPDVNSRSDRIELTYVVSDDFAATAEGKVVVSVRLKDANNEPDARNDAGVTVVGKPVRLDVLHNDTDPDNDPLFIAQLPTLVRPENQTAESLDLSLTPDGEFYFNPTAAGTYAFNYSATDGEESDVAQIRVEVTEPSSNRPPTAVRDDVVIPAGGSRLVYVLSNDGDPDGDIVALVGHTTDHGLTVKEVDGVGYLVTVAPNAPKRPVFRYQISDGKSDPVTAVVVVAVTNSKVIDQPPVARTDVVEVRAGGRVAVPVLANDYDPEGGALEVASVTTDPAAESTPGLNGQTVDIDVRPDVISSFTLSYTVADEGGNQASAFIEVRIVPADEVNRPPIARTDLARTRSGVPIAVEVVANDSDPDGDIIAVQNIRAQPGGGTARVDNGAIVYTPSETFSGTDRFSYALVDANGEIAIGEVLVGVMPLPAQNRAPEAFDDSIEVVAGSAPLVLDVLDNDSDPDGDRILVTQVGAPSSGETAVVEGGGAVEFTPPARTGAADGGPAELAFNYSIDDGRGGRASATVEVTVIPSTDPVAPIAVDDRVGPVGPGQTVEIDLLANDLDPDGNPAELTVSSTDPALAQLDRGTLTFTAGDRSSRHRYTVTDPAGLSDTAELAVLVVDNRAPSVEPLEVETPANETIAIDLARQASDPDGDPLYFVCCDGQRGGTARTATNGPNELTVRFNPDDRFAGRATFSYTADDQKGHIVAGSVTVNVLPPSNRPPTAADANIEVQAGRATNIDLAALVKDPDPGETFQFTTTPAASGIVQLRADGATVRATAAHRPSGRHRLVPVHRHRLRRRVGDRHREPHRRRPGRAAAAGPARLGHHEPGDAGDGGGAGQRHRPARPGAHGDVGGRVQRRHRGHRRPPGHVQPEQRLLRDDDVPVPDPRRLQHRPAGSGGPGHGQRHRPSLGSWLADGGRRQRHGHGQLGCPGRQRRADRRLRDPHRRGWRPVHRQHDRVHVDGADQRRGRAVQRAGAQRRRLGSVERAVTGRHARHRTRSPRRADGPVRRQRARRLVEPAGERRQRDHQLRPPDRRWRIGRPAGRGRHVVHLDRAAERHRVHVPRPGRERQGRGPVELPFRPRAPVARPLDGRRARGSARRPDDPRVLDPAGQRRRLDHRVRGADPEHRRHQPHDGDVAAVVEPAQRRAAELHRQGPQPGRVEPTVGRLRPGDPVHPSRPGPGRAGRPRRPGGHGVVDRAQPAGLRDQRLHDHQQPGGDDDGRRQRHDRDVRRSGQRHAVHVHRRRHQRRGQQPAQRAVEPGDAGRPAVRHDDHPDGRRRRAGLRRMGRRRTPTAARSSATSSPSTAAPGRTSATSCRRPGAASPTAPTTRSRSAP